MTASEVIAEVRAAGGRLLPNGDKLRWELPVEPMPSLVEAIRQRKPDLLVLLRYPATACPGCDGDRFWRDGVGLWRCGKCDPRLRLPGLGRFRRVRKPPWPSLSCGRGCASPRLPVCWCRGQAARARSAAFIFARLRWSGQMAARRQSPAAGLGHWVASPQR